MSDVKENVKYSKEHEWAEVLDSGTIRVGISDFAQSELGDIVFVELPEVGSAIASGDTMGTIESVKTVSDLYSPVSGTVVKVNEALLDAPQLVNEQPYDGGWIVEIKPGENVKDELDGLLTAEQYRSLVEG
ncbi:glycine cleavage system protein GcvH [Paenibacillus hamazuiensis]|uniref:glycine cleavage system protein GcvH n=1 Tax=Paenibacillus hamazuiensis TaxID=2936508 RepID=UPI00200CF234|nr:glycine cleavage system protein GcvH [Paenibacillus hamazuiensis]